MAKSVGQGCLAATTILLKLLFPALGVEFAQSASQHTLSSMAILTTCIWVWDTGLLEHINP
jgi:hypothetical protein